MDIIDVVLLIIVAISGVCAVVAIGMMGRALWRYRIRVHDTLPEEKELPTVSVCIPARNETHALSDCLQSVLQSDYPKLEVIVLDDCSQDQTSAMIRSFAHAGVRFVQGEEPSSGWLGKNHAYEVLAQHASGQYVVFMSVDTRVAVTTISQLIAYTLTQKATMVSVLPRRIDMIRASIVFATLRYFWQFLIPRTWHLPTATSLWIVQRATLLADGGFSHVQASVSPEHMLAKRYDKTGDYRFMSSSEQLGVSYAKKWQSQIETGIRLAYPILWRQPVLVVLVSIVLAAVLVVPYFVLVTSGLSGAVDTVFWLAVAASFGWWLAYGMYAHVAYKHGWWMSMVVFPIVVLQEIAILWASMVAYWRGEVNWKGRNVCYPVLRKK